MGAMMAILEGIAMNPQLEASIGNLVSSIATHMLFASNQPDEIKKLGTQLIANSGQIVHAVLSGTPHAPTPPTAPAA